MTYSKLHTLYVSCLFTLADVFTRLAFRSVGIHSK